MPDTQPWEKAEVAERFKAFRHRNLLTQERLAGLIRICRQSVSEIEGAHVTPHAATWKRFRGLELKYEEGARIQLLLQNFDPTHWVLEEVPSPSATLKHH